MVQGAGLEIVPTGHTVTFGEEVLKEVAASKLRLSECASFLQLGDADKEGQTKVLVVYSPAIFNAEIWLSSR